jgi:hypothetical protein
MMNKNGGKKEIKTVTKRSEERKKNKKLWSDYLLPPMWSIRGARSWVGIATRLQAEGPGVWIPEGARYFFLQNVQTDSGTHSSSYSIGTGVLSRVCSGRGVKLTHLHLLPRLRICGSTGIPRLPLCAFMAWTVKTSLLWEAVASPCLVLLVSHHAPHTTWSLTVMFLPSHDTGKHTLERVRISKGRQLWQRPFVTFLRRSVDQWWGEWASTSQNKVQDI